MYAEMNGKIVTNGAQVREALEQDYGNLNADMAMRLLQGEEDGCTWTPEQMRRDYDRLEEADGNKQAGLDKIGEILREVSFKFEGRNGTKQILSILDSICDVLDKADESDYSDLYAIERQLERIERKPRRVSKRQANYSNAIPF